MKKRILALMLVLILAVSFAACGEKKEEAKDPDPDPVVVDNDGEKADGPTAEEVMGVTIPEFAITVNDVEVTHEMMADYAIYQVTVSTVNSSGTESTTTFCGFALKDILAAAGIEGDFTTLTAVATDGYEITFEDAGELIASDVTLVALTKNGDPFKEAPWFAPCTSGTTGDYLKGMATIVLE